MNFAQREADAKWAKMMSDYKMIQSGAKLVAYKDEKSGLTLTHYVARDQPKNGTTGSRTTNGTASVVIVTSRSLAPARAQMTALFNLTPLGRAISLTETIFEMADKPISNSQLREKVRKGQAPKTMDRFDVGHPEQDPPHMHFKNGSALY